MLGYSTTVAIWIVMFDGLVNSRPISVLPSAVTVRRSAGLDLSVA
jgi:hypothetical protein